MGNKQDDVVVRIREKLDRANGVWSAVEGLATFNAAEMEADIREVLEDYEAVVAALNGLLAKLPTFADEPRGPESELRIAPEHCRVTVGDIRKAHAALVGEKEGNQAAGK